MIKKVWVFFKNYRHFGLVIVAIAVGALLDIGGLHTSAHWLLGLVALTSASKLAWDMIGDLQAGKYGIDLLAITAMVSTVVLHEYWASIILVLMLTGGEALEDYAQSRAKVELNALLKNAPQKAHLIKGGKTLDVDAKVVMPGQKLIIKIGEVVPVDCILLEGQASFDESSLTGESLPVEHAKGDQLLSGSINTDAVVTVKALRTASESQYEQIVKLVKQATHSQAPFIRLADKYSIPFTVLAFGIAGLTWALTGQAIRFVEVLVVATPCPLLLAPPIALISGMGRSAKHGIIVKTGAALERLAQVKTISFDKTGTLTQGHPSVDKIIALNKNTKETVLRFAAALEQNSTHVLGQAIMAEVKKRSIKLPKIKKVTETPGHGLSGSVNHHQVTIGKWRYIESLGQKIPASLNKDLLKETTSLVLVDSEVIGAVTFIDDVRAESSMTIKRLANAGIEHFQMVTGDNLTTANIIAKQVGISDVVADSLPADKLIAIENVPFRPVAFVGDGVNDAPVLVAADVGIALGARGSTVASESADIVIMTDDISHVATAVEISKRTFYIAKQSILMGIFISIGLMAIFATGKFKPVYGAAVQELVDVTVIFNALRAHYSPKNKKSI